VPAGEADVVLDAATATAAGTDVGRQVTLLMPSGDRKPVTVTGVFTPPGSALGGQATIAFAPRTAQQLLLAPDRWSGIEVTVEEGAAAPAVRDAVRAAAGSVPVEVKTREQQIADNKEAVAGGLSFFTYFLLGFAVVALLVGGFLIFNTFSMVVAQRSREVALLRAVGAKRKQVTRALLVEAFLVGLVGSLIGMILGLVVAVGLGALLGVIGLKVSITPTLPPNAILASLVLGIGITLLAAYLPLRRAGKIAPIEALRDSVTVPEGPPRRRMIFGIVVLAVAAGFFALGAAQEDAGPKASYTGLGALALIVATVALAPGLAAVLTRVVGRALPGSGGTPGKLARANTVRNPRRTAATASALMIGLALVTGITVVAASANASVDELVDGGVNSDLTVSSAGFTGLQQSEADKARVDGVAAMLSLQNASALVGGKEVALGALGGAPLSTAIEAKATAGTVDDVPRGAAIVDEATATANKWTVGQELPVTFAGGEKETVTLQGIYAANQLLGAGLQMNLDDYRAATGDTKLNVAFLTLADGADAAAVKSAVEAATAANPTVQVEDRAALKARSAGGLNQLLGIVYGLLALSILIAVLGVVNTMAMSVMERTREIGLLRAVGLTRRQARRMIRGESVLIAVIGGVLGVVSGLVLGVAMQRALSGSGIGVLAVPAVQILVFLAGAAVVGVLAALAPARRAAKMDVLGAIASH
jgi:putative ABC transport system permease protein